MVEYGLIVTFHLSFDFVVVVVAVVAVVVVSDNIVVAEVVAVVVGDNIVVVKVFEFSSLRFPHTSNMLR